MATHNGNWSYSEFLAFLLIYAAETDFKLTEDELSYIQTKTGIADIAPIRELVTNSSDAALLDLIEEYRSRYLQSEEQKQKTGKT